jgi:hypothetical protein
LILPKRISSQSPNHLNYISPIREYFRTWQELLVSRSLQAINKNPNLATLFAFILNRPKLLIEDFVTQH